MASQRNGKGQFQPGHKLAKGRPKGSVDRVTREFKDIMGSILFDDVEVTKVRLLALRDSDEPSDRKTFWGLASKMLPQKIEGKFEHAVPFLTLVQDYSSGEVREIGGENEDDERS